MANTHLPQPARTASLRLLWQHFLFRGSAPLRLAVAAVLTAAIVSSSCSKKKESDEKSEEGPIVTVEVAPVVSETMQLKFTANAVLYPLKQAAIVPKISAPVKRFYVERGSHVRAGQLLAELEDQDLAGAEVETRAGYEQAEANYEMASKSAVPEELQKAELGVKGDKETLDAQQRLYESRESLFQQGAISRKEVDDTVVTLTQARNQYEIAQKHLESLQRVGREQALKAAAAQREAAKGKHLSAQAQLSYSRILSPIDGVITDRPLFPGETASPSSPLLTVMDLSQVIARSHLSQQEAAQLKAGNLATLSLPDQGVQVAGKVTVVSPALDPNSTTVEVWVQAANPGERLKPGSSVQEEIVARSIPNALVIPAAALLTDSEGSASVMLADASGKPVRRRVSVGVRDRNEVQVTDGVQPGERVVTVGAFELDKEDPEVLAKTKLQVRTPEAPPQPGEEKEDDEK